MNIQNTESSGTKKFIFALSTLFFWVKGFIKVDSRFVKVESKNTILGGIIPAGQKNRSIPLKSINEVYLSSSYKIFPMFLGAILIIFGLTYLISNIVAAIILLIIGIGSFGSGMKTVLVLQLSGSEYIVDAPFFEKSKMLDIKEFIDESLAYEIDKGDLNLH